MEADEGDIVIEDGALKVAGTDKSVPWFQVRWPPTPRTTCRRHGAGAEETAFYDPSNFHLPRRLLHLRGRDRPGDRHDAGCAVRAADDFGKHHQSDDRRGPGAWRIAQGNRGQANWKVRSLMTAASS